MHPVPVSLTGCATLSGDRVLVPVADPERDREGYVPAPGLYALDVERCPVEGVFGGGQVRESIAPHVLGSATLTGTYSLNPAVPA